jgi:hypothetical protein
VSHNVGRIVTVPSTRIGPDGPLAPVSQGSGSSRSRRSRHSHTGDPVNPRVALLYADGNAPHADLEVTVEGPGASLGQLVQEHGLVTPNADGEPVSAFTATMQEIAEESGGQLPLQRSSVAVPLFDDGVHDDGGMEADGIYGNPLDDLLRFEGAYAFHAVATYGDDCPGRREVMWSVHVDPGIDPEHTDVSVTGAGPGVGTIRITPRDRYGNPFGPGRTGLFDVARQPGTHVTGPVTDNGDGSYDVPLSWNPSGEGVPGVLLTQAGRDAVPIVPPGVKPRPRLVLPSLAVARARPSPARSLADRPAQVTTKGR